MADILGKGINFPFRLDEDGRLKWSSGEENVRQSLKIILLTEPGERLFMPRFGAGLRHFLFQPNNVSTHRVIKEHIKAAINRWEPRVRLEEVTVEADPNDPLAAIATLRYAHTATGARDKLALTVPLEG